jgi:triosephosphate isomerase (TIM)
MIKDMGARFVIVGHSERRMLGEANSVIANKVKNSLEFGFHTILCIGEKQRDFDGSYLNEIKNQITQSLVEIPKNAFNKLIIAYEPVWAIGAGQKAIDAKEMHFVSLFIKKQLIKLFGKKIANEISIIYGGSVDAENAGVFIKESDIEGLLVGRASLNPYEFAKIITNVSKSLT